MSLDIGPNLLLAIAGVCLAPVAWRWLSIAIVRAQNEAPETIHIHHGGEEQHERY